MTSYTPRNEQITGANLTGTSGDASRTYVLDNDDAIAAQMEIIRAEAIVQIAIGFTFDATTNAITFLTEVWDDQKISINYLTEDSVTVSSTDYTDTLQVVRSSGIGSEIQLETLGTGDDSEDSFDTDNGNIIADSYTLKYGATGSNSLSTLTETTHYAIDKDAGTVLLTSAGVTAVGTNVLYITYTYSTKLSDTILDTYIAAASREAEKLTGNYWGPAKTTVQYFDGYSSGYPTTDDPYGSDIDNFPEWEVDYKGINSVTSIEFLDRTGDVESTADSDYTTFDDDGRIVQNNSYVPNGKRNIKITFVHGYTSVPALVQEMTALIASVMSYINITGGSYDDITTYTLGRKNFSIGEVYVNVREVIQQMKSRIDEISSSLGQRFACA